MTHIALDALYSNLLRIHQLMSQKLTQQAKEIGYNMTEFLIMLDILSHPKTDLNAICDRLGMKKSAVSKAVQKLVDKKDITRTESQEDRRRLELEINQNQQRTLCREKSIKATFSGYTESLCNLNHINDQLNFIIEMLSTKKNL